MASVERGQVRRRRRAKAGLETVGRGSDVDKGLIYPDRLIPGQTAHCHQEVM